MRLNLVFAIAACALATGCHRYCEDNKTNEELRAYYDNRPLDEVYAKHLQLVSECTPPSYALLGEIADFGPAAKRYALSEMDSRNTRSFIAARSAITAVNEEENSTCTPEELEALLLAARRIPVSSATREMYIASTKDACN